MEAEHHCGTCKSNTNTTTRVMSFPDTITLNIGSPAADVVFTNKQRGSTPKETIWFADSPDGDLAGRPDLRIAHEETRGGVVRSNIRIRFPQKDPVTGKYNRFISASTTVNRTATELITAADAAAEAVSEVFAISGLRADFVKGTVG